VDWLAISPPGQFITGDFPSISAFPEDPSGLRKTPESEEIFAGMRSQPEVRDRVTLFHLGATVKIFLH